MRGGSSVRTQTGRVATTLREVALRQAVNRAAAEVGVDPEELLAGAQMLQERAWGTGRNCWSQA
jgi:hypothetical protein